MKRKNTTRNALFTSVLSLLLCVSMLVGTTFAWFTDTAESGLNEIIAGNLDVALVDANGNSVEGNTELFAMPKLWEPGAVAYAQLKIVNKGTLDLKYNMSINYEDVNSINGHVLSEVLKYAIIDATNVDLSSREAVLAAAKASTNKGDLASYVYEHVLYAEDNADPENGKNFESSLQTLVIFWEPNADEVDNLYNVNNGKTTSNSQPLQINLGVKVVATQVGGDDHEKDSFGNDYDLNAPVLVEVDGVKYDSFDAAIAAAAEVNNPVINLLSDVIIGDNDGDGYCEAAVYTGTHDLTINGNGYTIYMIGQTQYINGNLWQSASIYAENDVTITVKNASISSVDKLNNGTKSCGSRFPVYSYVKASEVNYNDVDFIGGVVTFDKTSFTDCTFTETDAKMYALFCDNQYGGHPIDVTMTNCVVNAIGSYGCIKVADDKSEGGHFTANDCTFNNKSGKSADINANGTVVVTVDNAAYYSIETAEKLAEVLTSDAKNIFVDLAEDIDLPITSLGSQTPGSGEYKLGGDNTESIVIDLNGHKLTLTTSYMTAIGAKNADATITIKNGSMNGTGNSKTTWNINDLIFANCNYVIENVVFDKEVALTNTSKTATLKNVTINGNGDYYALWISARGQNVEIDGLTINSTGRGIKIDEQYVGTPAQVTLKVSNADINTSKKGAIMVKSSVGADITLSNVDIANTADATNAVWVDEDSKDYFDLVKVTGGSKFYEGSVVVSSAAELIAAIATGGDVTLKNNITISSSDLLNDSSIASTPVGMFVSEDTVLNMNGHNIVIADNGTGTATAIFVKDADLTIVGNGTITQEGTDDYLLWAKGASTVTIEGGTFVTNPDDCSVFYASGNTAYDPTDDYATINIYGGTFTSGHPSEAGDNANVMNHGVGRINYYGGTFNWDPSVTHVDDASYIKVADGYKVVDNGNGTWTVTAE